MGKVEWVRTALAVEQAGSITAGALARNMSQPAASQHLASLEAALGEQLFVRHRGGVTSTVAGSRFFRQVSGPLEQIAWLLDGLDAGAVNRQDPPVVLGCTPEWFEGSFLPLLDGSVAVRVVFGSDAELLDELRAGRADLVVTSRRPTSMELNVEPIAAKRYVLVAVESLLPSRPPQSLDDLARWITLTPWVGFSEEMPVTRRFWKTVTGVVQPTRVCLVAPDLRVVASAVEQGLGASLLPSHVCQDGLDSGRIVEVRPVGDVVSSETLFVSRRVGGIVVSPDHDSAIGSIRALLIDQVS